MRRRGEITVFLSLLLSVVLFFFQVLFQSAGYALFRSQLEEALEHCGNGTSFFIWIWATEAERRRRRI